ncbi:alcohol dehydrogenase catalytic domain-containing protein [Klebsiella pneumoniae]|nr:alcohol dehydrogenase catalytic domain-containing protein [Klebsiella pneumoniae]
MCLCRRSGHEGAGIAASVGEAVSGIRVGDHVVLLSYAACHHCENCLSNHPRLAKILIRLILRPTRGWHTTPYRLGDRSVPVLWPVVFSQYVARASNAVVSTRG